MAKRSLRINTILELADSTPEDSREHINHLIKRCLFKDENQALRPTEPRQEDQYYDLVNEIDSISACFKRAVKDGLISSPSNINSYPDDNYHPLVSFLLSAWNIADDAQLTRQDSSNFNQLLEEFNNTFENDNNLFKRYLIKAINFLISQNKVEAAIKLWNTIIKANTEGQATFCPDLFSTSLLDALIKGGNWSQAKNVLELEGSLTSNSETFFLAFKKYIELSETEDQVERVRLLQNLANSETTILNSFVNICKDKDKILRELLPFLTTYVPSNTYSTLFPGDEKPTADYIEGVVNYLKTIPTEQYQCLLAMIIFSREDIKTSNSIGIAKEALDSDELKMSTKRVLLSFLLESSTSDKLAVITANALPDLISDSQADTPMQEMSRMPPSPVELRHKVISLLGDIFLDAPKGQLAQELLEKYRVSLDKLIKTLDSGDNEAPNEEDSKADEALAAQQIFIMVKYALEVVTKDAKDEVRLEALLNKIIHPEIKASERLANFLAQVGMSKQAVSFLNTSRPVIRRYLTGLLYIQTANPEEQVPCPVDLVGQFRAYLKSQSIAGSNDLREEMELGAGLAALAIRGGARDLAESLVEVFDDEVVAAGVRLKGALAAADLHAAYDAVKKLEDLWLGINREAKGPLYLDLVKLLGEHLETEPVGEESAMRDEMCARVVILLTMGGLFNRTTNFFESGRTIEPQLILRQLDKISYSPNQDFTIASYDTFSNNKQPSLPQAAANLLRLLIKLDLNEQLEEYLWITPFDIDTLGPLLISQ